MAEQYESLTGKRVLIVDDEVQITSLVADVLTACGAKVTAANNGRDAMMLIQIADFDLVLLDLVMPDPDGWDVLRFMRHVRPALLRHTILLTGDRYHKDTLRLIDDAEVTVVYKPFELHELRASACKVLFRARSMPAA
jgi:DNA-binding response OmpR family regulator